MRRPVLAAALAGAAALGAVACAASGPANDALGLPRHHRVTQAEVAALPQASLAYPGSRIVRHVGSDERKQSGAHEPDPAFAGIVATSGADAEPLLAWYGAQMAARGYQPATYYKLGDQSDGRAWTIPRTRDQIQVGVYVAGSKAAAGAPAGSVTYEEILVNYRVTGPPPG